MSQTMYIKELLQYLEMIKCYVSQDLEGVEQRRRKLNERSQKG